jgi:ribosome-associated translation inhibitor RaiA
MNISISSPNNRLDQREIEGIEGDLAKLDRRLNKYKDVSTEVRISKNHSTPEFHVVLELRYGRNHLQAKVDGSDMRQAVRKAREELLRQINDRSRGGHSSFAKRV